jgi:hypothetical protein
VNEYLQVDGTVYTPAGEARTVRLRQIGPGLFEGAVQANEAGNYIVVVSPRRGDRRLAPVIGGVTRPTGAEYRRYRSNLALLNELVDVTGGRRLAVESPDEAALFDRSALPRSMSSLPAWPYLLWAALGLMLLDVACRRIAWRTSQLTALAAAVVRVPTRARTHPAQVTLATLRTTGAVSRPARTVSQPADDGAPVREAPMQGYTPVKKQEPVTEEPAKDTGRRAPTEEEIRRAIEAMREQSSTDERPAEAKKQVPEAAPAPDTSETTSRLLRAKRRSREEDDRTTSS